MLKQQDGGGKSSCFTVIGGEEMNLFNCVHAWQCFSHKTGCKVVERVRVNALLFITVWLLLATKHFLGMLFNMAYRVYGLGFRSNYIGHG